MVQLHCSNPTGKVSRIIHLIVREVTRIAQNGRKKKAFSYLYETDQRTSFFRPIVNINSHSVGQLYTSCCKMEGMGRWRGMRALPALLAVVVCAVCYASGPKQNGPDPDVRIAVGPLGYMAPSPFYLTSRLSSISLDFIDNNHLLFTFRQPGLMKRLPNEPRDDDDQMIRALVLELPSGKVDSSAEWRMHDRSRYLWRLSNGLFLVRQHSNLFATDQTLQFRPFLNSETALESVQISPDRRWIAIEAEGKNEDHESLASTSPSLGNIAPDDKPVQIFILNAESRAIIAHAQTFNAVEVPMIGDGHLQAIEGRQNKWIIRYLPFKGEARQLTEIESSCHPTEEPVSHDVTLIFACPRSGNDHLVSAINLDGKLLWQQRWDGRYIWPTFQLTQDGSRFAYSSLEVSHPVGPMDPVDQDSIVKQMVGVFDTKSGQLLLAKNATPILSAGQNYALSPDGSRFAILREGALEVYNLPPAPAH
jgi:hypothetical protein